MIWAEVFESIENGVKMLSEQGIEIYKTNDINIYCDLYKYGTKFYMRFGLEDTNWSDNIMISDMLYKGYKYSDVIQRYTSILKKIDMYFNLTRYRPISKCTSCGVLFISDEYETIIYPLNNKMDCMCEECTKITTKIKTNREITGCVYFYKSGFSEHVKIGYSRNVNERIDSFSTAHAGLGKLLFSIPGNYGLEKKLHKRFNKYHYSNEWFSIEGELKDMIYNNKEIV